MRLNRFQLFVIQQPLLCVCWSFSVLSLIWCCLSLKSTQIKLHDGYTYNKTSTWARADCITGCVFLHANIFLFWGYTQSACYLIESRAHRVSSWWSWLPACGAFFHCVCMSSEAFSSWVSLHLSSLRCPSRFRLCGAVAALVGIAVGSGGGNEDGQSPIFSLSHQIQRPLSEAPGFQRLLTQEPLKLFQWYHIPASEGTQAVQHCLGTFLREVCRHTHRV